MIRRIPAGAVLCGPAISIALFLLGGVRAAASEDDAGVTATTGSTATDQRPSAAARRGRVELRRQNTGRGTEDESTRTTLRLETYLAGAVSRLRLDLPFPDEKTGFAGDPFSPRLGDIKLRAYFRRFDVRGTGLTADVETTLPTADPPSLGSGKYQIGAALHSVPGAPDFVAASGHHRLHMEWSLRHTLSVAGDASRKDINNTKPELALRDEIGSRHSLKLTFKPVIDWVQDARTGAVLELEAGWNASRDWRFLLMAGAGLWGEGTPGWYQRRVELVVGRTY